MLILGIETSCDETAAAVVRDGHEVRSSVVYTQIAHHRPYGGVVPEIASRMHVEHLPSVIERAMSEAGAAWPELDAIAVTYGPGLASSLLVGLAAAKGLALRLDKPLIGINHLEAHLYSIFLDPPPSPDRPPAPCPIRPSDTFLALIVSGGHTCFVRVAGLGRYRLLGRTLDDAAGEAFDKGANLLHLGYPGGPAIDNAARNGDPQSVRFPRGFVKKPQARFAHLNPKCCVSYSGLKTALLYHLKSHPLTGASDPAVADLAATYQEAIVDTLVSRASHAIEGISTLAVVGGVSLNRRLREKMAAWAAKKRIQLVLAAPRYGADNAAMVAGLAAHKRTDDPPPAATLALDAEPNLAIG